MATYLELFDLGTNADNNDLLNRTIVAVTKKAQTPLDGATPTTNEVTWAAGVLSSPRSKAQELLYYILAANSASSTAQILAATDATLQTNIDSAADALIAGGVV